MPIYVEYKVRVLVEVDLDDDTIVGVYVDDEQVDGPFAILAPETGGVSDADASQAAQLAESKSWPAWEFGL